MPIQESLTQNLADWFVQRVFEIRNLSFTQQCHLLLCASDLGIDSCHSLDWALSTITQPFAEPLGNRVVEAFLRQAVLLMRGSHVEMRREFLHQWIEQEMFRKHDIVTVACMMGLAAEQLQLLSPAWQQYVAGWFTRHRDIESNRIRAWLPRYLLLTGFRDQGIADALQLLSERSRNGSWQGNLKASASMAYSLWHSTLVDKNALSSTVEYVVSRLCRGFSGDTVHEATVLKLLSRLDLISSAILDGIRSRLTNERSVFLSHSSADKAFVRMLAEDLRSNGIRVWVDEAEIRVGDSIVDRIEAGLSEMRYFAVVFSPASVVSPWVRRELNVSLFARLAKKSVGILPMLIEACELPALVRDLRYADFRQDYHQGLASLLQAMTPRNQSGRLPGRSFWWPEEFTANFSAAKELARQSRRKPGKLERLLEVYHAEAVLRRAGI